MSRTPRLLKPALSALLVSLASGSASAGPPKFTRGDTDASARVDITDSIRILGFLFLGAPASLDCADAADADDNGALQITDAVLGLNFLFTGGPAPRAPFPDCGEDSTADPLGCSTFPPCQRPPTNTRPVAAAGSDRSAFVGETVVLDGGGSSDADGDTLTYRWALASTPEASGAVLSGAGTRSPSLVPDRAGVFVVRLVVSDGKEDSEADDVSVAAEEDPSLPPDPSRVAPELDGSAVTDFAAATAFLHSGDRPIQTGVAPGTIEPLRAAVLRGKAIARGGEPLAGAAVSILGRPEFGSTLTRRDGLFDLAVNGGAPLTVVYEKEGFLTSQRRIEVPWQEYAWLPAVCLVPLDPLVTAVDLDGAASAQVAEGSRVIDEDGERRACLLFPAGTRASLVLPDGSVEPAPRLHIRASEFTVGPDGPDAMPAELPPSSGYTYCVELSADEALAAGAAEVRFDRPAYFYLENFLDFPDGEPVPAGYYDRKRGLWVPADDGRVIRILDAAMGLAVIDADGDGAADGDEALAGLGFTAEERQRLAGLFEPGRSLWRVPIPHLTPWDCNWPYGPPDDAEAPPDTNPFDDDLTDEDCERSGSIIGVECQVLGERIPIAGTSLTLNYRSDRAPGRASNYLLEIQVSGPTLPPSLTGIGLKIVVAGRQFFEFLPLETNQTHVFVWDGKDAYGRTLQGAQPVAVTLCYDYRAQYFPGGAVSGGFRRSFLRFSGRRSAVSFQGVRSSRMPRVAVCRDWKGTLDGWDARAVGLGGWTLDLQHAYDPSGRTLYHGSGEQWSALSRNQVLQTMAGGGTLTVDRGQGGPATNVALYQASGITFGPDGSLYISDFGAIHRVDPDGSIRTIAGRYGAPGFSGNGGPAASAHLGVPLDIAFGPDGSLHIADAMNHRVRRIGPDGIITTVAGNGVAGPGGDEGPATAAQLDPRKIAFAPDGSLYIAELLRIRRVDPDGIIHTHAGGGTETGEGVLATAALLPLSFGLAAGSDGAVYFSEDGGGNRVRRIGPDGIINTVAGTVEARLARPFDVEVAADGSLLIADGYNRRIRQVLPDGTVRTIAGGGEGESFEADGSPAVGAPLQRVFAIARSPDGSVAFLEGINSPGSGRVRRIANLLPSFRDGGVAIASRNGAEVYHFDAGGRHLRTLDALDGATRLDLRYDGDGQLAAIEDRDGNVVAIERDPGGSSATILAPFGQATVVGIGADGWIESIANPAGETTTFTYGAGGLLASLTDPGGNTWRFDYDSGGRLVRDEGPDGALLSLAREKIEDGFAVAVRTAMGRDGRHAVEQLASGGIRRRVVDSSGIETVHDAGPGSVVSLSSPAGAVTMTAGPDPRWGMQVQLPVSMELRTPGGLRAVGTHERVALLENPLQPLSLLRQTETIRLGGRVYTREEDPRARTSVVTLPSGRRWVTERDEAGRMALLRFASLHPIRFLHDERGRFAGTVRGEGAEERRMLIARDAEGRIESITDALGNVRRFTRDAVGRLVRIEEPDGGVLRFAHDARGNLISVTPPDRPAHAFSYTAAGLPSSYLPPAAGAELRETSIERNLDGQPIGVLRPDGRSLSFEYDGGGRLSRAVFPDRQVSVSYDSSTGALAAVEGGGLRLTYGHDGGLPTSETWSGAISGAVRWTYDNDLRIASQSVDGAGAVDFAYDADGRLSRAGTLAFERDPASGLITGAALGVLRSSWAWNGFAEPVSHAAASGGVPLLEATYRRDKLGRIFEEVETIGGSTIETSYQYDAAGRLVRVIRGGSIAAEYSYDRNGNRVGASGPGGAITADFDAQDRMTRYGDATYSYTAAGELLAKTTPGGTTRYDYDVQGNLLRAELPDGRTIQYLVDPWDRRVAKVVDGTRVQGFLYEGFLRPVVELDGAGRLRSRFIYGSRANVPEYMVRDGRTYRLIHDPRGSPRLVVDAASGEVAQRLDYDAFGNVTLDSNPGFQPFGFAGGLHDPDTGLVRFGVRDYDPETGRWTAKDPLLFGGVSANFYAYARNDPVNRVDPTGELAPLLAGLWVAVEVGLTVLDFIATLDTVLDACATAAEKWTSVGLFALGVFIPTGGFAAGKWLARTNRWPRLARWADDVFGLGSRSLGPQVDREGAEYVERYIRSSGLTEAELRATSTDIDDAYRAGRSSGRVTDRPHRGRPYNDYPFESWP